ncbi:LicD family protein [Ruminococcus albus]|uniref:Lipopolysaccharide cholinephosphotransferase n=1 Tax=Ruminococcus albus TaxID=1264 RepID=A0A1H7KSG6_RUMAL|nr:LicD family protein [Ruminococcus albus]SEK88867.1 lipopolysaccharide cholinephosphotransferase [Ruminococcus albus]
MLPIRIDIPEDFYQEEKRCNYLISKRMKKAWSIQLDLLSELNRICQKHNLVYYADSGTLIGAIRHKGYIPWDDDIDIVMKREDYDRLIEIAKDEFKEPYFLQNVYSDHFVRGYTRLRNSKTTAITIRDARMDFNKGIFIDIFPLDHVPDDESERKKWINKIRKTYAVIHYGIQSNPNDFDSITKKIKSRVFHLFFKVFGYHRYFKYYESICKKYNSKPTKYISYVAYSRGKDKHIWESKCFETCKFVPFEFTNICIPIGYDSRLRTEYGDYMEIRQAPTAHGDMILEPEVDYLTYMKEHDINEIINCLQERSEDKK